jgi:alpha-mannosidase
MPMDLAFLAGRFERFARDVLAPAVYPSAAPLSVGAFQCAEPVGIRQAEAAAFEPVPLGWAWGPVWSTAWFRVRGVIPRAMDGRPVVFRFSCATEALAWRDGAPWHGLDLQHDAVHLADAARAGDTIDLLIEAACTHNLGQLGTHWDPEEFRARWRSPSPGRLERCELAVVDPIAWRLHRAYLFALALMRELPGDSARGQALAGALRRATNAIDDARVHAGAADAAHIIEGALHNGAGGSTPRCLAVGHAHIDTAWLWPVRESRRKCLRTFATALANLHRSPDFRFLCSQAQQYAWVEHDSPALFERIREQVHAGRWEPGGAMWIEPDANLVSGESFVRQILHADRYWRSRFGERGAQSFLYLPDTFGFSPALPQIMAKAGLSTFITHKLSWNQANRFPHTHFLWRGLDGTEVLAHQMPGHDYNLQMSPRELRRGEKNHDQMDAPGGAIYLQPFGFGDGGGGPTDWQILHCDLARDCEGLPRVQLARADDFCRELHAQRARLLDLGEDFPRHEGELYLEAHRGTFTTQAAAKASNRRAEHLLHAAEVLSWAGPDDAPPPDAERLRREQDDAWRLTLLNQFHDILPGSSIAWVYEDAARDMARVRETADAHVAAGLERWAARVRTVGVPRPVMVFNPTSAPVNAVVEFAGEQLYVEDIPAMGVRVVDARQAAESLPASGPARHVGALSLDNGLLRAEIDDCGRLLDLRTPTQSRPLAAPGHALHELMLFEDRPRNWDAWDIDPEYDQKGRRVTFNAEHVQLADVGPLRAGVSVKGPLGERSSIELRYILEAGAPFLRIEVVVDWQESHRLLRAQFPTTLRASTATYECAFGHLARGARANTPVERAAFEVPAHRWADLTDDARDLGLALLNDAKYGHSCRDGVLGLSLLRAPAYPDETADRGLHRFTYALLPHAGDWRAARVDAHAESLNAPCRTWALPASQDGPLGTAWSPVTLESVGGARPVVAALKAGERPGEIILRLVETHGRHGVTRVHWHVPVRDIAPVDLLERPIDAPLIAHDAKESATRVPLGPFEIVTLRALRS